MFFGIITKYQHGFIVRIFGFEILYDICGKACYENIFAFQPRLFAGGVHLVGKPLSIPLYFELEFFVLGNYGQYVVQHGQPAVGVFLIEPLGMREARGLYLFRCKVARILVYSPEVFELMPRVHADYGAVLSLPKVGFNHKASHIVRKLYGLGGILRGEISLAPVRMDADFSAGNRRKRGCANRHSEYCFFHFFLLF